MCEFGNHFQQIALGHFLLMSYIFLLPLSEQGVLHSYFLDGPPHCCRALPPQCLVGDEGCFVHCQHLLYCVQVPGGGGRGDTFRTQGLLARLHKIFLFLKINPEWVEILTKLGSFRDLSNYLRYRVLLLKHKPFKHIFAKDSLVF